MYEQGKWTLPVPTNMQQAEHMTWVLKRKGIFNIVYWTDEKKGYPPPPKKKNVD